MAARQETFLFVILATLIPIKADICYDENSGSSYCYYSCCGSYGSEYCCGYYSYYYSNTGSTIGGVIGSLVSIGVVAALIALCCYRRRATSGRILANTSEVGTSVTMVTTHGAQLVVYPQYPNVAQPMSPTQQPYPYNQAGQVYPTGTQAYPIGAQACPPPAGATTDPNKAPMASGYTTEGFQSDAVAPPAYKTLNTTQNY